MAIFRYGNFMRENCQCNWPPGAGADNSVTRVSDIMGWRLDLINKLTPPAAAAQQVYYCGNRNDSRNHALLSWIQISRCCTTCRSLGLKHSCLPTAAGSIPIRCCAKKGRLKATIGSTRNEFTLVHQVMDYLLNFPDAPYAGRPWQSYFNFTFVDARKPSFFAEGTVLRQVCCYQWWRWST